MPSASVISAAARKRTRERAEPRCRRPDGLRSGPNIGQARHRCSSVRRRARLGCRMSRPFRPDSANVTEQNSASSAAASSGWPSVAAACAGGPAPAVIVFEKEDDVAVHQTGHNSGVVHAGLYYKPGCLKAQLCTRGPALLREYCAENGLPYEAVRQARGGRGPGRARRLDAIEQTALANGVPGLRAGRGRRDPRDRAARRGPRGAALAGDGDHRLRRRRPAIAARSRRPAARSGCRPR